MTGDRNQEYRKMRKFNAALENHPFSGEPKASVFKEMRNCNFNKQGIEQIGLTQINQTKNAAGYPAAL